MKPYTSTCCIAGYRSSIVKPHVSGFCIQNKRSPARSMTVKAFDPMINSSCSFVVDNLRREEDLEALGDTLGTYLKPGDIVLLTGNILKDCCYNLIIYPVVTLYL